LRASSNSGGHSMRISVVIPAHNEVDSIGEIVRSCKDYCSEIIVVDDGSTDETFQVARDAGAFVIRNDANQGIVRSTQVGLKVASGDIIVTLDADGQHDPSGIPEIIGPIVLGHADMVQGKRTGASPLSERAIGKLVRLRVTCEDVGTGFRAFRRDLAQRIQLWGCCLCGSLILEAARLGARIVEVPIEIRPRRHGRSHWSSSLSRARVHSKQMVLLSFRILSSSKAI
jgi:glycosyltransferase involved in cell wall biosynthesis